MLPEQLARRDWHELETLAEIGRALLAAQLDEDELCELIYRLAGRIVPTDNFQLGLWDGDRYLIKVRVLEGKRLPPSTFIIPDGHGIIGWLRQSGTPLLVRDFQTEIESLPARPSYQSDNPPRSAIFMPLVSGDTVTGSISIQSHEPSAFDEGDLSLLQVLANQAAAALFNASLYNRNQRRVQDLTVVAELGRKITSILNLDELLTQAINLIGSRFSYYHAQIFLTDPDTGRAHFRASTGQGLNEKWLREDRSLIGDEGIIGWVAKHGEPLMANDVSQEPRYIPDDPRLLPDTRAELAVPLRMEHAVLGVLDVQNTEVDTFDADDLFILSTLADQVAVAVNAARAYEAQQEEAWVTTVMLQVAEVTGVADGVDEVLDAAVRVIAMLGGVESCSIWLWNDDLESFDYSAGFGLDTATGREDPVRLSFTEAQWPALVPLRQQRRTLILHRDADEVPEALKDTCHCRTLLLLPMLSKGQVFGMMGVSFPNEREPVSERRIGMLSGIGHQIAAAIDNSRLSAARQEEAWVSAVLLQVADATSRVQPIGVTLEQAAHLTPLLAGVDRCVVLLRDNEGNFVARAVHSERPELEEAYRGAVIEPEELPLLDDAIRLGQPMVVDETMASDRVPAPWREKYGSRALLVVPMSVSDEVIGALLADDVGAAHRFSPRRVRILSGIAAQTAMAIENARLQNQEAERARLARELELAQSIQRSLLPQEVPQLRGYEIVYRWRAAREVGGDFFDFIPFSSGSLGLLVADVSDKGIPAALYMMFARTVLRAVALSGREPMAMLARSNELMVADSTAEMFVTAYYSVLNPRSHTLTYASGGHNLALYAEADDTGPACPLVTNGLALGILSPVEFQQKTLLMAPGDVILFYTDGLNEALNRTGDAFGDDRLASLLAEVRHLPAEEIAEEIESALKEFVGDISQYDDLTLIVLKRNEPDDNRSA